MVNDIAVQEFVNAIKETPQDTNKTYNATVSRVDDEGVVWVNIHGSEKETPTASTSTEVKRGDAVTVNWRNNKLYIGGNYSNPSAGVVRVASVEQNAEDARLAAEAAEYNARLAQSLAEQNAITMANTVIEINNDIADLQNQIDGNITTWFYDYQPTTSNAPASTWTTVEEKNNHLGDLFYDTSTGYAYRWMSNGASTPTFSWSKITDTDVTTALATALAAQDTADHKRRVFITTPTVPYDVGDLWCEGTTGDILTCTHARTEAQSYSASDWSKLNKYTDDTRADEAYTLANTAKVSADGKNKIYRQATQPSDGTYVVGDIWFDTSHSNKIYRYSGSAWVAVTLGDDALDSLSANKLTAGTIDASIITVSNLDAGNITTGNLAADRMKVNSISAINSNTGTVKIQASKVEIDGTAIFNNSDFQTALDAEDFATSSDLPTKVSDLTNDSGYQTASDVSSAVSSGVSGKADKTDAVARQQRIYYRKTASGAPSKNTTWLSTSGTGYGNWSLKIPPLTSGSTKYPYLYTAVQTQTVSQQAAGSTCSCSDVLLDDSTTVIDGGNIITGTVTANQIAGNTITANKIRIGDFRNYVTATENDATSLIGASTTNSIVDGWIYKSDASATNLWVSPVLNNWTKEGERYRVTGKVKTPNAGKAQVVIYGRLDNASSSAQSAVSTGWTTTAADTETELNGIITISSGVATQPKSNIVIAFQKTDGTTQVGYFKQLRVERMSDADLIVDGSITADKIAANALTIGKMDSSTQSQVLNSNMQIGGRNLLTGTAESKNLTTAANQNYFNPQPYKLSEYADVAIVDTSNTQIAVSFDYTITDVDTAFNMMVSLRTALPTTYSAGFIVASIPVGNSSGRAFGTRDITSAMRQYAQGYGIMVSGSGSNNANAKLTISNVKLEFGNKATDWSPAPEDVEDYTDEVAATLSDSFNGALAETASELSGSIEDVRTLAGSKADATALSSLSTQMQEYIGEGGYIYANNGTLIIATGRDIGNFKIGLTGQQIVFYENDIAVAYIEGKRLYISRSEVTDEQKISNFAFKKRDDGRFTLMYVGG